MGQILFPPEIVSVDGPVIFLAGPIQGAPLWQEEAITILARLAPTAHVASPRRRLEIKEQFSADDYLEQVDWETYFLGRAGAEGAILFWLAKEQEHLCHRAYGQTSRFELGEWKERACRGEAHLVVGIEQGFSNARYIRHRLSLGTWGHQGHIPPRICSTLEETCKVAAELCSNPFIF